MFKDITYHQVDQLAQQVLKRELTPLEYNMFLHHYIDELEKVYYLAKQKIDNIVLRYINEIREKQ